LAIYHLKIKIISRSDGRSAIASAAYRSGEKLQNDETGLTHDFTHRKDVITGEILLPQNAPKEYLDRKKLWLEVQKIESRSDARLAREIEIALPVEMSRNEQIECVRNYIDKNFVSKGMIADWNLHDKGDGNPHIHIMLTCRRLTDDQQWDTKARSVFANDRDAYGRAVYNPDKPSYDPKDKENTSQYRIPQLDSNGNQKYRDRPSKGREYLWEKVKITTNDWDDRANAEIWRKSWAEHCNRYLPPEKRIDHRSYERQGIDKEPTIHEGVTARKIESEGKSAERVQINREIKERNTMRHQIKLFTQDLTKAIKEKARNIYERFKEFVGHCGDIEQRGRYDEYAGESTLKDIRSFIADITFKEESSRTAARNREIKRADRETSQQRSATKGSTENKATGHVRGNKFQSKG